MRPATVLVVVGRVPSFLVNKVTTMQPMRVEKLRELVEAEYQYALQDAAVMETIEARPIPMPPNLNPEPEQEPHTTIDVPSRSPDQPPALTEEEFTDMPGNGGDGGGAGGGDGGDGGGGGSGDGGDSGDGGGGSDGGGALSVAMGNGVSPGGVDQDESIQTYTPLESMTESDTGNGEGTLTLHPIRENPVFENIPWKYKPGSVGADKQL